MNKKTHNKRMQLDQTTRYARRLAADAGRYSKEYSWKSMEKVLLLGNGLNRLNNVHSWKHLINDLNYQFSNGRVNIDDKPFPLLYEEIVSIARNNKHKEREIQASICETANNIHNNNHHLAYLNKFKYILTTNYDYALEKAILSSHTAELKIPKSESIETRYSLERKIKIQGKQIWHIHGEARKPNTICLGYDHYSGYLQKIRQYLTSGGTTGQIKEPIAKRIAGNNVNLDTWTEFFFTCDINIVGLNLSFVESELWWLLVYRNRLKQNKNLQINNQIKYYRKTSNKKKEKNKKELLSALGVQVVTIDAPTYDSFYDMIINRL